MTKSSSTLTGIVLMVGSMACFACMNTGIRALSADLPSPQMAFLRNISSLGIVLTLMLWLGRHKPGIFKTSRFRGHFWRAALGLCAMETWFYAISIMPISTATALSFTTPIFVTLFAIIFFGEKAGWRRWLAIMMGFFGVLLVLKPGVDHMQVSAGYVLASSALMALASVVVKSLTRTESPELIVFYMALIMTPLSLPFALMVWKPVPPEAWWLVGVIAVSSTLAQLLLTRAYLHADMVVLMPFDFTRLIFVAILGYEFFGEVLDGMSWLGAAIITASSVYIAWRESRKHRNPTTPTDRPRFSD